MTVPAPPYRPRPSVVQLLDFATAHPGEYRRSVDDDVRRELGITPARYFQLLIRAIATEEALAHDPILTHRLRRMLAP